MKVGATREDLEELTAAWQGERFPDGRPRVPDDVLARLRTATIEQAWSAMRKDGFDRQFAGGWQESHPGNVLVGRAVTAQFLPHRPDYDAVVVAAGAREGHQEGDRQNSWVIERLETGDVMVVDLFGKIIGGSMIGDNLGTAVASRTGVGAVINGSVRDLTGIATLDGGVNFFFREADPRPILDVTLVGINIPVRIGEATVLPGDIVLGTPGGISVIPPQLAEQVAEAAEDVAVRDVFGKSRLANRVYTSADIDVAVWAEHIERDFQEWKTQTYRP